MMKRMAAMSEYDGMLVSLISLSAPCVGSSLVLIEQTRSTIAELRVQEAESFAASTQDWVRE